MGREHLARLSRPGARTRTTARPRTRTRPAGSGRAAGAVLSVLTALTALLLLVLTAAPAGAGTDGFRGETARAVRAHERARARVDRLREEDAPDTEVRAAERRRKAVRAGLWDLLWATGRNSGDPVAVDASGRDGHCPFGDRSRPAGQRSPAWTAPIHHYWLSAGYAAKGSRWAHRHTGQDFAVDAGSPVYAVGSGTVQATTCGDGFGNQVVVRHRDGYFTQYAHLSRIDVRKGERVTAGRRIGLSGATGNVTGPHLHFEVRITPYVGSAVPPLPWLRRKDVRVGGASLDAVRRDYHCCRGR
ncbi:M23 family metallopeptidase [Streptomyces sp. MBT49]|uniref:M23 family metallopeptidase n=1 Tax=Streptomyces sp. MBT49 TaxID=1488380 RepID=UPI00190D91D4|nr:peptidoglycan DD-metalloendopeptidase family protein [Streptomyces sp. MBT49]MBK3629624.1 M23 family metallopeptidase [Streptomyces sp. MBT49]